MQPGLEGDVVMIQRQRQVYDAEGHDVNAQTGPHPRFGGGNQGRNSGNAGHVSYGLLYNVDVDISTIFKTWRDLCKFRLRGIAVDPPPIHHFEESIEPPPQSSYLFFPVCLASILGKRGTQKRKLIKYNC
jgi:hypothetical protein